MSTKAEFEDYDGFAAQVKQLKLGEINWLCVGHVDDNVNLLRVLDAGSGTIDDLASVLSDSAVCYCLVKVVDIIDRTFMSKFVYIRWIGPQVPIVKLGKYGVVHGSIQAMFQPYHDFIESSSTAELTEQALTKRIREISGTSSKVVEGNQVDQSVKVDYLVRGNNMNKGESNKAVSAISATHKFETNTKLSGKDVLELDPSALEAIDMIRHVKDPNIKWILLTYVDKNCRGPITLHATGCNDIDELKEKLQTDKVFYGIYTLNQKLGEINTLKYVSLTFVGDSIPIMAKAIIGTHRQTIEESLGSCHTNIVAYSLNEISENLIESKLIAGTN